MKTIFCLIPLGPQTNSIFSIYPADITIQLEKYKLLCLCMIRATIQWIFEQFFFIQISVLQYHTLLHVPPAIFFCPPSP